MWKLEISVIDLLIGCWSLKQVRKTEIMGLNQMQILFMNLLAHYLQNKCILRNELTPFENSQCHWCVGRKKYATWWKRELRTHDY